MIAHDLRQVMPGDVAPTADEAWLGLLRCLLTEGRECTPRGQQTYEVLHHVSLTVDLNHPVVTTHERHLNYRFMAAEALWIANGKNDLATLEAVNPRMAEFSDDGLTLAGAYGPRIRPQVPYVVQSLRRDRDTRQAALTVWTPSPMQSRDIPCTVAMVFSIRKDRLYQHVFMRSSDAWLGIPYDVFSFSFLAAEVACAYNLRPPVSESPVGLGHMTITCTSSHLYMRDVGAARALLEESEYEVTAPMYPPELIARGDFTPIRERVEACARRAAHHEPRYPL